MVSKTGIAVRAYQRDGRGDPITVEWRGAGGRSWNTELHFARVNIRRDAVGNMEREEYLDTDGKPTLTKDGYTLKRYDERGNVIGTRLYVADGKQISGGLYITSVIDGSVAEISGLAAGDIILEYDDESIISIEQYFSLLTKDKQIDRTLTVLRDARTLKFRVPPGKLAIYIRHVVK